MTPHTQAFLHDPELGVRGDCYRTAIACLLDVPRDDVPHVLEHATPAVQKAAAYLKPFGLAMLELPITSPRVAELIAFMAAANPDVPSYLLSGTTRRGWDHTVVVHDRELWDPHPSRAGLIGPCADGFWWIGALVKVSPAAPDLADPLPLPGAPS